LELFDSLYTNKHGLQDKYLKYWEVLAKRWAKDSNVIGFDPINEPMVSNFVKDLSLLMPKKFDFNKLQPLYEKIFKILYKYNMYQLIHFETA
jgi:aryl-phospho-beta-D-glucosidase BglC (GH1 family)